MLDNETLALAKKVNDRLIFAGHMMVTAESCTGGLIAGAITSVSGSSAMLYGGFVTYSNKAKTAMIDVPEALIDKHGAVSEPVAQAMAKGALRRAGVDLAISVTGIAGPGGGSDESRSGWCISGWQRGKGRFIAKSGSAILAATWCDRRRCVWRWR